MKLPMKQDAAQASGPSDESLRQKWAWQDDQTLASPVKMNMEEMAVFAEELFERTVSIRLSDRARITAPEVSIRLTFAEVRKLASIQAALALFERYRADAYVREQIARSKSAQPSPENQESQDVPKL